MIARDAYNPDDAPLDELRLGAELRRRIVDHLAAALPNEGCGLLAVSPDDGDQAIHFFPGSNVDASPTRFTMDGKEVIDAFHEMERRGWRLGAIVHSHPRNAATPSATDLNEALYPAALMVICSFAGDEPELRAWAIAGSYDQPARVVGERPIVPLP
jgi:proteasome lid subunit RPN8/RPN11